MAPSSGQRVPVLSTVLPNKRAGSLAQRWCTSDIVRVSGDDGTVCRKLAGISLLPFRLLRLKSSLLPFRLLRLKLKSLCETWALPQGL